MVRQVPLPSVYRETVGVSYLSVTDEGVRLYWITDVSPLVQSTI